MNNLNYFYSCCIIIIIYKLIMVNIDFYIDSEKINKLTNSSEKINKHLL